MLYCMQQTEESIRLDWAKNFLRDFKNSTLGRHLEQSGVGHLGKALMQTAFNWWQELPPDLSLRQMLKERPDGFLKFSRPHRPEEFRVVLVQPPLPVNLRQKRIIPMNLAYLAAYLREKCPNVNVGILDCQVYGLTYFEALTELKKASPNLIGLGCWTVQTPFVRVLSESLRRELPKTFLVAGGVQATLVPEEIAPAVDVLVMHEGEETLVDLCRLLADGRDPRQVQPPGIAWLDEQGTLQKTPSRGFIANLDDLPFPAYDLVDIPAYENPLHVIGGARLPVIGSRGCPYDCSFCASPRMWQRKVRWRSGKNLVAEMKALIKEYGISYFHFWDDNFTLGRTFVQEFCREVLEEKLEIKWVCLDRAEHVVKNADLLPLMKEAGCIGIEVGMESANPDTFLYINKQQDSSAVVSANDLMKRHEIAPLYTCMAMNPGETINGYYFQKQALDRMQEGLPWFQFFHPLPFPLYVGQFATPYPHTGFESQTVQEGTILRDHPEDRFHHQINFVPFSLMNDVPLKNRPTLDRAGKRLLIFAFWRALWVSFDWECSRSNLQRKLREVNRFLVWFWDRSNGRRSIAQIALLAQQELNFPMSKANRFCALTAYFLGQLGWIRSSIHNIEQNIIPVSMELPWECELQLMSVLFRTI